MSDYAFVTHEYRIPVRWRWPRRRRQVVLWGARRGDRQFGSQDDRLFELERAYERGLQRALLFGGGTVWATDTVRVELFASEPATDWLGEVDGSGYSRGGGR